MKKMKTLIAIIAVVMVIALVAGCTAQPAASSAAASSAAAPASSAAAPASSAAAPAAGEKIKIGITYQDLSNEYIKTMSTGVQAKAKELGVELIEGDGQGKAENQIAQAENFITLGVKAMILSPFDKEGSAPVITKGVEAGIPVVLVNSLVTTADQAITYVGSDSVESGRMEMQLVADKLGGKGNIVVIEGPAGHSAQIDRLAGIKDVLTKYPDIKIVGIQNADWDRAKAMSVTENFLQSGLQFDAVVAENDEMGMGALKALEAAGKLNNPTVVVGIDAIPDALQAVKDGKFIGTIFQDAIGQGAGALEKAVAAAKGEKLEKQYMIPYVPVTKDNLANYLK